MMETTTALIFIETSIEKSKTPFTPAETLVSNEMTTWFTTLLDNWLCFLISIIGVVSNVLVIMVFTTQGFKESLNITMTTIAFWDLVRCVVGVVNRLHRPISYISPSFGKTWENGTFLLIYLHVLSGNVSYVMAAYVAIERCLCVSMPFKVKTLITPRVTTIVCVVISNVVFWSKCIIFFMYKTEWAFSPEFNATIIINSYNDFYETHGETAMEYYKMMGFIYPVGSLIVITISTLIIIYHLQKSSAFRAKVQAGGETDAKNKPPELSDRDKQVVKMLLVVILVYIINLIPRFLHYIFMFIEPEYYYYKLYHNLFKLCVCFIMVMDFLNVSINLFIFLSMSSNFRATFYEMFPRCASGSKEEK